MKKSIAWPSILAMAVLHAWGDPAPCVAQTSTAAGTATSNSVSGLQSAGPQPAAPPSSVSPAIERFLRESGRDRLPVPTATPSPMATPPTRFPAAAVARLSPLPVTPPQSRLSAEFPGERGLRNPSSLAQAPPPSFSGLTASPANGSSDSRPARFIDLKLKPAPLESTDLRFPINLASALRLADARPLIVAAAQASVWVAEAQLTRAKVLWVPTVIFAADYYRHDGGAPDFNKGIMTHPSFNYFYGGPGLWQYVNLTDAIFQPLAARQVLNARQWDVQSAKNDALLQTADAYFLVHQYRGRYAGALYTVERAHDLVDRVLQLSRELVPQDEVDRARNMLADMEQLAVLDRQEWRVQSANLTQVLRLDPRAVVDPLEHDHTQISLIDPSLTLDELMPIALVNRPEISARRALLEAAEIGIRREKSRPLLPLVTLNGLQSPGMVIQGGLFALGPNNNLNQTSGRADISLQLVWQLEGFGIGNLARIKSQRGMESRAIVELRHAQDMVAAEVNRALARVQSAAARVLQADRALRTGIITFNGHLEGLGQTRRLENVLVLTYRPQEAVYSLELLNVAFHEYFTTVADYNRAQFELYHALGYPARELTQLRSAGEVVPVDTSRPGFLPPVGNGPPPATR
jgi:outer membrane protein TolC